MTAAQGASAPHEPRSVLRRRFGGALFGRLNRLLSTTQAARADQFAALTPQARAIVFLGDSITEGGLWSEWFPGTLTINRGISGETTTQIGRRLHTAIVDPRAVFLLAGTNDVTAGEPASAIASRLAEIVDRIRTMAPNAPIYLQSVMPRKAAYAAEVRAVNVALQQLVAGRAGVHYLDLWPVLATRGDALIPDYSLDGLHLNGAGYQAWVGVLDPLIRALISDGPLPEEQG